MHTACAHAYCQLAPLSVLIDTEHDENENEKQVSSSWKEWTIYRRENDIQKAIKKY